MEFVTLLGLFLLKHGLLVHAVDFGYSHSRLKRQRTWYVGLFTQNALEAVLTTWILWDLDPRWLILAAVIEQNFLLLACLIERQATHERLVRAHVQSELLVLACYIAICVGAVVG